MNRLNDAACRNRRRRTSIGFHSGRSLHGRDFVEYYEAETVEEAIDLLEDHAMEETELLAGGHSLLPAMKTGLSSPDVLIDIGEVDALHGATVDVDTLTVGAMNRYSDILESEEAHEHAPALTAAVENVGDRQVRNRGTISGNLRARSRGLK